MMEKQRKKKMIIIIVLVMLVIGLTVAFAALSQVLTINGELEVDPYKMDVHYNRIEVTTEDMFVSLPQIIDKTTIGNFSVTLTKPGDLAAFGWDVVNDGETTVKATNITVPEITCTSSTGNKEDEELICGNQKVEVMCNEDNGSCQTVEITTNALDIVYGCSGPRQPDSPTIDLNMYPLKPGESTGCMALISYSQNATELSTSEVTVSNLGMTMTFSQQ